MNIIPVVLLCLFAVGLGTISTIYSGKKSLIAALLKGLTIFAIIALSLVVANLKELNNALPMFVVLALALEMLSVVAGSLTIEKPKYIFEIFQIVTYVLLVMVSITLGQFNILSAVAGLLIGCGIGLLITYFSKKKVWKDIVLTTLQYAVIGMALGVSILGIVFAGHLLSAILCLVGLVMILSQMIIADTSKNGVKLNYVAFALRIIGFILIAMTIYCF